MNKFFILTLAFIQISSSSFIQISHQTADTNNNPDSEYCTADKHDTSCSNDIHTGRNDNKQLHGCFRAAIFEHNRIDLKTVQESVGANLEVYKRVAQIASDYGTDILVFPEDGLFKGKNGYMIPALSEIPDPELLNSANNNPCLQPTIFDSTILRNLSCIARDNNMYVVANFGTKQSCEPKTKVGDQICPDIGYFALNTDVVLDSDGNFIKRYRKYNLFIEVFNKPPSLETVYFDSPYGRFGLFTCFDMMFKRPAIDLVEKYQIDTALFPTWWFDELPLLSAIQFQDGWSWKNGVNLLAANIHKPETGSVGSGIYSGHNSVFIGPNSNQPKLLIANLPNKYSLTSKCSKGFHPLIIDVETDEPETQYKHKHYSLLPSDSIYTLNKYEEKRTFCIGQVCCMIDYKINPSTPSNLLDRLVLLIRDGLRPGHFKWHEQVCALVTLESPINKQELNKTRYTMEGVASFDKLFLKGTFTTEYVYPVTAFNVSDLVDRNERELNCDQIGRKQDNLISCKLNYSGTLSKEKAIYSFGMYGRLYDSDKMPDN